MINKYQKISTLKTIEAAKKTVAFEKSKMRSAYRIKLPNGDIFRSEFEFNVSLLLKINNLNYTYEDVNMLYKIKEKWDYRYEYFGLTRDDMNMTHKLYFPDFISEDKKTYLEVKGNFSAVDRTKMILVKNQNPEKRIIMVLQAPNQKATTKLKAWEWCEKYDIEWCNLLNMIDTINKKKQEIKL